MRATRTCSLWTRVRVRRSRDEYSGSLVRGEPLSTVALTVDTTVPLNDPALHARAPERSSTLPLRDSRDGPNVAAGSSRVRSLVRGPAQRPLEIAPAMGPRNSPPACATAIRSPPCTGSIVTGDSPAGRLSRQTPAVEPAASRRATRTITGCGGLSEAPLELPLSRSTVS